MYKLVVSLIIISCVIKIGYNPDNIKTDVTLTVGFLVLLHVLIGITRLLKQSARELKGTDISQLSDDDLKRFKNYKEWLDLDSIERDKLKAVMTDQEKSELRQCELVYFQHKGGFH